MDTIVKLENVIKGMKTNSETSLPFLNKNTGAVVYTQQAFLLDAKGEEYVGDLLDWQLREMELAYDIVERPDKYAEVPALNWRELREQFGAELLSGQVFLSEATPKELEEELESRGLLDEWNDFVDSEAKTAAVAFCEVHGLNYKTY